MQVREDRTRSRPLLGKVPSPPHFTTLQARLANPSWTFRLRRYPDALSKLGHSMSQIRLALLQSLLETNQSDFLEGLTSKSKASPVAAPVQGNARPGRVHAQP